jgi:hypothetical protein
MMRLSSYLDALDLRYLDSEVTSDQVAIELVFAVLGDPLSIDESQSPVGAHPRCPKVSAPVQSLSNSLSFPRLQSANLLIAEIEAPELLALVNTTPISPG